MCPLETYLSPQNLILVEETWMPLTKETHHPKVITSA